MSQGETLDFPVTATGAPKAADDINNVGKSMNQAAGQWDKMSQGSSKAAAGLGAMSAALGPLGAEFGALGSAVSRSAGIITNMTSLLGGPWGIAIGAAAAAVGFLAKQWTDAKKEADALTESMKDQAINATALYEIQNRYLTTLTQLGEDEEIAKEAAVQRSNQAKLDAMAKQEDLAFGPRKSGGGGFKPTATQFGEASDIEETADVFAGNDESEAAQRHAIEMEMHAEWAKEEEDLAKATAKYREDLEKERLKAVEKAEEEAHDRKVERIHQENFMFRNAANDQLALGTRALNEAAKGHAMGKKAAVQAIGDSLVARGTAAMIEGGIFSATPFMWGSGSGMIAAGATAVATGVAMGAASKHMGSGDVGKGASTGTPQLAPASPVNINGGTSNSTPTVININMQSTLSPNADDYDRMMAAANASRKQGRA